MGGQCLCVSVCAQIYVQVSWTMFLIKIMDILQYKISTHHKIIHKFAPNVITHPANHNIFTTVVAKRESAIRWSISLLDTRVATSHLATETFTYTSLLAIIIITLLAIFRKVPLHFVSNSWCVYPFVFMLFTSHCIFSKITLSDRESKCLMIFIINQNQNLFALSV